MAQHIGIVACSAEGASLCYRTICAEGAAWFGPHAHPPVSMHTPPLADYMARIYEGAWRGVAKLLERIVAPRFRHVPSSTIPNSGSGKRPFDAEIEFFAGIHRDGRWVVKRVGLRLHALHQIELPR